MLTQSTVSVSFPVNLDTDGRGSSPADRRITGVVYGTGAKVRKALKIMVRDHIEEAMTAAANNYRLWLVGCADGTVMVVRHLFGSWEYSFQGPDRKHGAGSCAGFDTYEAAAIAARHHAETFGGIAWESGNYRPT